MDKITHYIQRDILLELYKNDGPSFSELQPDELENAHFSYHLKVLISGGYVEKEGKSYRLTANGYRLVNSLNEQTLKSTTQPKNLIQYVFHTKDGRIVISERTGNSSEILSKFMLPGFLVQYGVAINEQAKQYTANLLDSVVDDPKLIGVYEIMNRYEDNYVYHAQIWLFQVLVTEDIPLKRTSDRFKLAWYSESELKDGLNDPTLQTLLSKYRGR